MRLIVDVLSIECFLFYTHRLVLFKLVQIKIFLNFRQNQYRPGFQFFLFQLIFQFLAIRKELYF